MPPKGKRRTPLEDIPDAFHQHLTEALKHVRDARWLGERSPLAAPYFLGERLRGAPGPDDAARRGGVLRQLLHQTTDGLAHQGEDGKADSRLLKQTYFQSKPVEQIAHDLSLSRAGYFRHRDDALRRLSAAFIRQVNPALRLELPAKPPELVGRDDVRADCLRALRQGQTVALTGPGGIGKTTLGADLVGALAPQPVFWFTFNPGLNDRLSTLLFALGYFLWGQGAASLWGQLVADKGWINMTVLPGLLRHDLQSLRASLPVLCFDEVDLLRPDEVEAHAQILALLENLRGLNPCLFVSQRPLIEVDEQHALTGLTIPALQARLASEDLQLPPADLARLQEYIRGNPRLLELFITLHRVGEPMGEALPRLANAPSLEFLLNRIWQRLDEDEQQLLADLTAFRRPVPGDAWDAQLCDRLVERRLAQPDVYGGLALLPAFREVIYKLLPAENRQAIHLKAAEIRAARADYTAAAYHYLRADHPRRAVWLWHAHRAEEINQGRGSAALALFEQASPRQLKGVDRDVLVLIRGELSKLMGEDPRADLRQTLWRSALFKAQARRLEGDLAELKDQYDQAIAAYQAGLKTVENLLGEQALFYQDLGWAYMRLGGDENLSLAWRNACRARFEAERLQGTIQQRWSNFAETERYYQEALASAGASDHAEAEQAKTYNQLGNLLTRQGKYDSAKIHHEDAARLFQKIGNQVHLAGAKLNTAFDYNMLGQHQAILPPAAEALARIFRQALLIGEEAQALFERLGQIRSQAVAAENLAEAHLYLGDLSSAERFARRVIQAEDSETLPDGLRTLGEVKAVQRDFAAAETLIRQSLQITYDRNRYLEGYGWRALGWVYFEQRRKEEGRAALDKAIALFEALELPHEVARTQTVWERYR